MILAAGCSWTDSNFVSLDQTLKDQDRGGWPMWPEVMGTKLGLETKNLGLAGCDNRYIFNSVIDEIWKHTKIDLCVVMWTGWDRFQYLNTWKYPMASYVLNNADYHADRAIPNENRSQKDIDYFFESFGILNEFTSHYDGSYRELKKYSKNIVDGTLRYMHMLSTALENNNIPYLFAQGVPGFPLGWISGNYSDKEVLKDIMNCMYMPYLKKNKRIIGFPFQSIFGGSTMYNILENNEKDLKVSELDMHPNAEGQRLIAQELMRHL